MSSRMINYEHFYKRLHKIVYLFVLIPNLCLSQTFYTCRVKDFQTKEPLTGAVILSDKSSLYVTDNQGLCTFKIDSGKHTLFFSYVGYNRLEKTVFISDKIIRDSVFLHPDSNNVGVVVVTASKYSKNLAEETVSMEVVKPSFIQNTNDRTVDESLNKVPGINIIDGQANIRGGSGWTYGAGSRVLVLVDDIPQLTADAADVKWEFLPIENLDQIEIIKGAASTLYGSGALDGVINFRTAYPTDKPQTTINLYQGFYGNPRDPAMNWWGNEQPNFNGGYFSHSQKFGQFDLVAGANYYNDNSYAQGEFSQRLRIDANARYRFKKVDRLSAGLNINYLTFHSNTFFLWANDTSGAYMPYGGVDTPSTTLSFNRDWRFSVDPFINYFSKNGDHHELKARYFETNNGTNSDKSADAKLYYAEYDYTHPFSFGMNVVAGITGVWNNINSLLYGNHSGNNEAGFVQLEQKISKLSLVAGIRYESYKLDTSSGNSKPIFRAGANYQIAKYTFLRASFGQGYRFPSVAEKYIQTSVGSLVVYPDPQVQPETGWTAELGVNQGFKISDWVGYGDAAVFTNHYNNFIDFTFGRWGGVKDPFFGLGFKSENIESSRINGVEITVFAQGKLFGLPADLTAGITQIDPINLAQESIVDSTIKANPNLSSHTIDSLKTTEILNYRYKTIAKASFDIQYKKFSFGADMFYNSFMINIDPFFEGKDPHLPVEVIPGVREYRAAHNHGDAVFDGRLSWQFVPQAKVSFIVKNIFNREYSVRPALLEAPINYQLDLMIKI